MKLKVIVATVFVITLLAFNASAGCGKWVVRDNTDYLDDPTFDAAMSSTSASTPGEKAPESSTQSSAQPSAKEDKTPKLDVSGKWLVKLGKASIPLNLILIQSSERVQGYGSLNENSIEIPATVVGSISEDTISLDAKLIADGSINKVNKEYKIGLAKASDAFIGSYQLYIAGKLSEKGNVTATRSGQ